MMTTTEQWKPGDRAYWMYEPRGGYGYVDYVYAIIRKVGPKRITVDVAQKIKGEWVRVKKLVSPEKLQPRNTPCADLGE